MAVKLAVHQKHVISPILSCLDEGVLCIHICSIKEYHLTILVSLSSRYSCLIILNAEILAFRALEEGELHCTLAELLVRKHTELDEELKIVPLLLKLLALISEDFVKTVSNLLSDVCRDLLYISIALKIAS